MSGIIPCSMCNTQFKSVDSTICDSCEDKYVAYLTKIMPLEDAENLIFLIGNTTQSSRWNTEEIVKQQDELDELSLNYEKHDHKHGKLVNYL